MGVINNSLIRWFYYLGDYIGRNPNYFVIVPILVSLFLGTGLIQMNYIRDVEYLFTQTSGASHDERAEIVKYFPANSSGRFDPSRPVRVGRLARLIVTAKDGGTLLTSEIWNEILQLNDIIHKQRIEWRGDIYNYSTLCARWNEDCFENEYLDLGEVMNKIENKSLRVSYPVMFNPITFRAHALSQYFGGVIISNDSSLESVEAILLYYFLAVDSDNEDARGLKWERKIIERLQEVDSQWKRINIYKFTFSTLTDEMETNILSALPYILPTVCLMVLSVMLMTMMGDWVKSKPLLGFAGVMSALLGSLAGAGALAYAGVPVLGMDIAVPFLMLGIGVDDAFVMLASWRRTSPTDPVPTRLAEAYSDAAVSITITTLTDMLSFYVGILTPIPSVQYFSAYAGTCVLCIYFWMILFFGGCMAISGYHEAQNRHCLLWWIEATPKSKSDGLPLLHRLFFTGGVDKMDPNNPINEVENVVMVFLRDSFSTFICKPCVRVMVIAVFILYIGVSLWGVSRMQEGLKTERIARDDSYVVDYFHKHDKYFRVYPYRIQVIITTPLDYSSKETQERVQRLLNSFQCLETATDEFGENWLRDFIRYVKNYKEFYEFNVTTEQQFIDTLRNKYLRNNLPIFEDVKFNANNTKIIATRYIVQSKNILDSTIEKNAIVEARNLAAAQTDLNVTIFHSWFHFGDQFIIIRPLSIKLVSIAVVIVLVVALVFIPSIVCSICVLFTIASIELGVLGFMSILDVNLDVISLISLIMCIGFSVDFAAHISYAYISSEENTSEKRIREAMYGLGLPILQGGISTIIGISTVIFIHSYILLIFLKIICLVIVFATFHALFILPVFLSVFQPEKGFRCSKSSKSYDVYNDNKTEKVNMDNNVKFSNIRRKSLLPH